MRFIKTFLNVISKGALRKPAIGNIRQATTMHLETVVQRSKNMGAYFLLAAAKLTLQIVASHAQTAHNATSAAQSALTRDGQHDFDFSIGQWRTHIKRRLLPLTGSETWAEFEGTSIVRRIWNGRANLGETEADGPAGHLEALSLRLYNPEAHQWNLSYASGTGGSLSIASVGEFKNGRGEFFDTEPLNGRSILVRQVWSDITANSCRFEQSFSEDGGKTWEVNWITTDTRVHDESDRTQ